MPLDLYTHNVNGFKRNDDFVRNTCLASPLCIYGLQEHWLKPPYKRYPGVNGLMTIHPLLDGWGTSAMKIAMESGIRHGRPFGGTGYLWSKSISAAVKPRTEYQHERVTVLQVESSQGTIIIINAYMPFYDLRNIQSQVDCYMETIGFIESIISQNRECSFILLGDMNCNTSHGTNRFSSILNDFVSHNNFCSAYGLINNFDYSNEFTRSNDKSNSYSLLDYVFISPNLMPFVKEVEIVRSSLDLSDHCPVRVLFDIDVCQSVNRSNHVPPSIDWKRVDCNMQELFSHTMENALNSIAIPDCILHGNHVICSNPDHQIQIERYYNAIIECIAVADDVLPRIKTQGGKRFWNEELSRLKNDSIAAFDVWKSSGCPKNGPVFEMKKNAYYRYKIRLKLSKNFVDCRVTRLYRIP